MNPRIESLEKMLDGPRDGALLRFSLGNEYLKAGDPAKAGSQPKVSSTLNSMQDCTTAMAARG